MQVSVIKKKSDHREAILSESLMARLESRVLAPGHGKFRNLGGNASSLSGNEGEGARRQGWGSKRGPGPQSVVHGPVSASPASL